MEELNAIQSLHENELSTRAANERRNSKKLNDEIEELVKKLKHKA